MTTAHSLWMVGVAILFGMPILFMILDSAMRSRRRSQPRIKSLPPPSVETWCAGCDQLVPSSQMGWSEDGDYRCVRCLEITTSSGSAEIQAQLDVAQVIPLVVPKVRPPKGGGGVVIPRNRVYDFPKCPDCEAFGHRHCNPGRSFPFEDWGNNETVKD